MYVTCVMAVELVESYITQLREQITAIILQMGDVQIDDSAQTDNTAATHDLQLSTNTPSTTTGGARATTMDSRHYLATLNYWHWVNSNWECDWKSKGGTLLTNFNKYMVVLNDRQKYTKQRWITKCVSEVAAGRVADLKESIESSFYRTSMVYNSMQTFEQSRTNYD